ncbi:MAG: flagellar biosynthesis protein FlhA [Candidatus Acididesulfobacter guangdongensis]|uniref:Flagellar biosynthesis protein FlhA n=1 Tax=Acididesulfobacter guangdongensis TaxID=2597225 RepID=A0A519BG08_ACIG2|nr:MAG: flagellar biosynthesis protein FlhA [Candidatus Acididesulfobacter guangdongensis]
MANNGSAIKDNFILKNSDIVLALMFFMVIILMVLPITTWMLDIFLTLSISFSIIVLLISIYVMRPLEFSTFPTILLFSTVFRLSLEIAATRLILLYGYKGTDAAGVVIQSFGKFIIGGNYAVGIVIFIIFIVINFLVVTKGAGRVAEVAARFTLDAMPGKQMSVDAELNSGLINDQEARKKRSDIIKEADFYGSMDGASKFVRGDVVAAIVIIVVNIIGGLLIGIFQHHMSLAQAASDYTLLSIGEGLVAQIPALIVSTASGVIITRASRETNLSKEFSKQFATYPRALYTGAGILFFFGIIPGLPHWPFILLALILAISAFLISRDTLRKKTEIEQKSVEEKKIVPESQILESVMQVDIIELEVGYGLISYVDSSRSGELLERIKGLRKQIAADLGMIVPPIHIKDNLALKPNEYVILIKGVEVSRFEIMPGKYLAMNPGNATANIAGTVTKEPAFNLPALWIDESEKQKAQLAGWTVVEIPAVIATHIVEIIKQNAAELLTRQDTQKLLNILSAKYPKIVDDLIPNVLSLSTVQKILENLLNEGIPIKDMLTIIETLLDYGTTIKDPLMLTEYVRSALKRTITKTILDADGSIKVITLGKNFESAMLNEYKKAKELGVYSAIEQPVYQKIIGAVKEQVKKALDGGHTPVILTSPAIRLFVKNILKDIIPGIVVVSSAEIAPNIKLQSIGNMEIDYAN